MVKSGSKAGAKHKKLEGASPESKDPYRVQADDVPVLIWGTGPDGCDYVNRAYLEFLGVDSHVDVQHFDWARYVHPDDREGYLSAYLDCFRRRVPFSAVFRFRRHDGEYRWMKSVGQPRYTSSGEFSGFVGSTQDITDVMTAEEVLRESEARFRALADNIPNLAWMANADGWIFWYNKQFYDYTGMTLEEMQGWGWQEIMHPDYVRAVTEEWISRLKVGEPYDNIFPLRGKDGNYRWFLTRVTPIKDEHGKILRWFGTNTDITERRQMEEELRKARDSLEVTVEQRTAKLRESEEKYRRIVETAREGIWILDRDGVTSFVNPAVSRMLGYAEQEIVGKLPFDFIDDTYRENVRGHLRNRREGAEEQYVCKYRKKDGGEVWAIITANPICDDDEYVGAFAMITDITERKRAEDALKERERQLAEGQVLTDTGSWEMDLATGEVTFSDNMIRIVGLPPGRHTYDEFRARVHPEDRERRDAAVMDSINGKRYDIEYRLVRPDGDVRQIHAIGSLTPDPQGKPVKFIATIQDITERKLAEEALLESEAKYRDLVENANSIIIRWDLYGNLTFFNEFAEEYFGYPASEVLGKNVMDTIVPSTESTGRDLAVMIQDVERHPQHYKTNINENIRRNGERVWISWTNKAILDAHGNVAEILSVGNDITERKRAEEALRDSEEKFRALADTSYGMIAVHRGGNLLYVNDVAEKITGYSKDELLKMKYWEVFHADSEELIKKRASARLAGTSEPTSYESKILTKDGKTKWINLTAGLFVFEGKPAIIATIFDITERKRAEEVLQDSEEKFRVLAETAPVAICIMQDGKFQYVNTATEKISRYDRSHLLSTDFLDLVHPDFREPIVKLHADWLDGRVRGLYRFEIKILPNGGDERWVDVSVNTIEYRGRPGLIMTASDITERRQAEETLRESETSLVRAQAIAHIGDWEWDLRKGEGRWSDELYNIFGLDKNSFYPSQENFLGRIHPEDRPRVEARINAAYSDGKSYSLDFRIIRPDGSERTVYCEGELAYDKDGKPIKIFGINQDITERRRAEEAGERLGALMDHNPSLIFMKDEAGRYVYLNNAYEKQFVLSGNWFGKTDFDFWPKESAELFRANDAEVLRSGRTHQFVEDSTDLQGKRYCWLNYKFPFTDSYGNKYVGGIGIDVTDRIRAEEALRGSEEKFRVLFEGAGVAILVADVATGRIIDCNKMAEKLTGRSRDEIIGLHQTQVHPADKEGVQREQFARHAKGIVFNNDEAEVLHRDGRIIPVIVNAAPLNVNGRDILIGFFLDITERKRAEEDRIQLIHDLGERVKELRALHSTYVILQKERDISEILQEVTTILPPAWQYPDVTAARISFDGQEHRTPYFQETPWVQRADFSTFDGREGSIEVYYTEEKPEEVEGPFLAEERALIDSLAEMIRTYLDKRFAETAMVEAKTQAELYLDLMGHDINNMHQIALGYLELARSMNPPEVGEIEFLDKPMEVLQRSAQLIQNVRKLQKLQEGTFQSQDVDVCQVLRDLQREFGAIPNKAISLDLNGCERCHVRANELLHDVFANLVSNAIKHTGDQAEIAVGLDVVTDNDKRYCRVMVEDDGPGIPDDFKVRIFNRVLKGTNHAKGIGLGLYLVKSLVDSYGGRVWVEDRVKGDHTKGARFVVMLPAADN